MRFTEVEHKFVVGDTFKPEVFALTLDALGPTRRTSLRVRDRYFMTGDGRTRHFILRHRFDEELQQLTMKSLSADPEVRDEINLDLGHHRGDQSAQVDAFVARLGVVWSGVIHKDIDVWYFPDCEVVHYVATSTTRVVRCVEFEAIHHATLATALAVIERYEQATGFDPGTRSKQSLVDLLFPGVLS